MPSGREVGSQLLPGATPCGHIRMAPTGPGLFAATPTRPRGTWVPPRGGRPGTVAPRSSQGTGWPRRHRCLDAFTPPHGEGVPSCPAGVTEQGGDLRSCPLVEDRRASHPNSPRSRALLLSHRPARCRDMEDQGPLRGNGESAIQPVLGPRATGTGTASQSSGSLRSGRRGRPWAGMAVVESLDGGQGARKAGPARRGDVPSGVLFEGGRIYTGDPQHPWATALAAWAGRVIAVGDRGDLRASFPGYRRVDLHGSTVLPGFTDSHIHLASFGLSLRRVNLRSSRSLQEAVAAVAEAVTAATPGEWIQGGGWVNSAALARAGITRATPDPPGGMIVRDPSTGEPTGLLLEEAVQLIAQRIPPPSAELLEQAILDATRAAHEAGITGVHVMEGVDVLAALQRIRERGALHLRVVMMIPEDALDAAIALGIRSGFGDPTLRIGGVKIFADGALGSQTASMLRPYDGQPGNYGVEVKTRHQ